MIRRHSHPKARPEIPTGAAGEAPAATGIDYLKLITTVHRDRTRAAINYEALTNASRADSADSADCAAGAEGATDPAGAEGAGMLFQGGSW